MIQIRKFFDIGIAAFVFFGLLVGLTSAEVFAVEKNAKIKTITVVPKKVAPGIKIVKKNVPQKKKVVKKKVVTKKTTKPGPKKIALMQLPHAPAPPLSVEIPDIVLPPMPIFEAPAPLVIFIEPSTSTAASSETQSTSTAPATPTPSTPATSATPASTSTAVHEAPFIIRMTRPEFTLLTRDGVLQWTNTQRASVAALPALSGNAKLDAVAKARLDDLFEKQYFEHVSPDGTSAKDDARTVGYSFILIGENLALGDFGTDERVVGAWMESPGHRANILNTKYTELGVAAKSGIYQGRETWMAVQIFGTPLSSCQGPSEDLKSQIADSERAVDSMKEVLVWKKKDLESRGALTTQTAVDAYNALVQEHNTIVEQMNALIANVKLWIAAYNDQVAVFNQCLKSFSSAPAQTSH